MNLQKEELDNRLLLYHWSATYIYQVWEVPQRHMHHYRGHMEYMCRTNHKKGQQQYSFPEKKSVHLLNPHQKGQS